MPFPFKSIFYLKNQRTIQVFHNKSIKHQYEHSIHTNSKQLCLLHFKHILMGQPIKLSIVASFINIYVTIFNWYYVTRAPLQKDNS